MVLCNDPDMTEVPTDVPVDTVKLRIEKTAVRSLPADAFYHLGELHCLWVSYNSVAGLDARSFYNLQQLHELRLDGNGLAAFPWVSLRHTPRLRTLALRNNAISSVPAGAAAFLRRLTFLDLSSNRLATLPPDFLDSWSHLAPPRSPEPSPGRVVLGKRARGQCSGTSEPAMLGQCCPGACMLRDREGQWGWGSNSGPSRWRLPPGVHLGPLSCPFRLGRVPGFEPRRPASGDRVPLQAQHQQLLREQDSVRL